MFKETDTNEVSTKLGTHRARNRTWNERVNPLTIDLGLCVFCPICEQACPAQSIHFTNEHHITCGSRSQLVVDGSESRITPELASKQIRKLFGRSLKLRQISAEGATGANWS